MEKSVFDVDKFNTIEDEESYYFFRALNIEDNQDIERGETVDSSGKIERIKTDRERQEENPEKDAPKYSKKSEMSLEEVYDHIKMHYRKDTNCISLSSNANVSITYGRGYYKDKYVMVKVPKREMGKKVVNAGQYMLEEISKKVDEYISSNNIDSKIAETLFEIENAKTADEIKNVIKQRYTSMEELDPSKAKLRKGITYRSPVARISSYQALNEEQLLEKNKIIAKLTLLERVAGMEPIISHTKTNNLLVQTVGNAFSSLELVHYGDIEKESIVELPKEVVDIFALLQQAEGKDKQLIDDLKSKLVRFIKQGNFIDIERGSSTLRDDKLRQDISIEEMYEKTEGKVEYGSANSIVKSMFYLAKSQKNARALANMLMQIVENDSKYNGIIKYISENGFRIEPEIITRRTGRGVKISESTNLDLKGEEVNLIDKIKELTEEEQVEIIENGGLSDVRNIMSSTFSKTKRDETISKEEYYAEAIFSLYDWEKIGIEEFTLEERNDLLKRLQEEHCLELYQKLLKQGMHQNEIPTILLNLITRSKDFEIKEEDTPEHIREKRFEQYDRLLKESKEDLDQDLSIERIERFLGYYDVENTEIQLRPYQERAVERADEIYETERFTSVILPTGAGKSFVTLAELMKHQNEEIIYLAPQNEIIEQMKDYIIKYIHGPVNTLGRTKDEIVADVFPNLKFSTYPGLLSKDGEETINKEYGFIVLDELHRTGAKEWGDKLDTLLENQPQETKVLGITATPRRDVDGLNMANEMAEKLGYTNKDATTGKHIAMNMSLKNAIRMGLVVNPKLVTCAYNLKADGSLDKLKEKIDLIEDVQKRNEEIEKYETLRRNLDNAEGISEILQENVKKGGKYIVFLPMVDEIEDEDGNKIGRKKGKAKIKDYEKQVVEYFKDADIKPNFHSMLGEYGDKENQRRLEEFQNSNTEEIEFMLVMNKANEGLHLDKLDGMIWLRALDENSRILYLQQLGRVIYSEDPDNPTKDEDRPTVIDLVNNTLKVRWDTEITEQDDIDMLSIIVDWTEDHDGMLPSINSTDKEEKGYASVLKDIQSKYIKYLEGEYEGLNEKQIEEVKEILNIGSAIDLWNAQLPKKTVKEGEGREKTTKGKEIGNFELEGILKDFVELEDEVDEINNKTVVAQTIEVAKVLKANGVDLSKIKLTKQINKKTKFLLLKELEQKGIDILKIIEENGLDGEFKFGRSVDYAKSAYKGTRKRPITEEEKKELDELGLIPKEEKSVVAQTIEVARVLKENGVDLSKIQLSRKVKGKQSHYLLKEIKQEGIDILKIIEENGLDGEFPFGRRIIRSRMVYNGKVEDPITEEEKRELDELGLIPKEEKSVVAQTIEVARVLKENGVDLSKIKLTKQINKKTKFLLLKELEQKGIDILKIIEKNELDGEFEFGKKLGTTRIAYKGKEKYLITEEEKRDLEKLGIISKEKKSKIAQTIEVARVLKTNGVDLAKIKVHKGRNKFYLLKEIKQEGIDILKIIEENGLDGEFKFGEGVGYGRIAYKGKRSYAITEEEKRELEELGLISKEEKSIVAQTIEVARVLKENGVDLSKIQLSKRINGKRKQLLLKEIEQEGIDILKIIEEKGIDGEFEFGKKLSAARKAYNGNLNYAITEEEKRKLEELGLLKAKITGEEIGMASFDVPVEECDSIQEDLNRKRGDKNKRRGEN